MKLKSISESEVNRYLKHQVRDPERFTDLYGPKYLDFFLMFCSRAEWIWTNELKGRGAVCGVVTQPFAKDTTRIELRYRNCQGTLPLFAATPHYDRDPFNYSHFSVYIEDNNSNPIQLMEHATRLGLRFVYSEARGGRIVLFDILHDPFPLVLNLV